MVWDELLRPWKSMVLSMSLQVISALHFIPVKKLDKMIFSSFIKRKVSYSSLLNVEIAFKPTLNLNALSFDVLQDA